MDDQAFDFRAWRGRMGWTQGQAADALDYTRRAIIKIEKTGNVTRVVELACRYLEITKAQEA